VGLIAQQTVSPFSLRRRGTRGQNNFDRCNSLHVLHGPFVRCLDRCPCISIPSALRQNIRATVANLQALGEVEDGRAELAKLKREFEVWSHNAKAMRGEFDEAKRAHDKVAKEAWEKQHEVERLDKEIKAKTAELSSVSTALNKIRQQLGG
jgi:hypothetical protein